MCGRRVGVRYFRPKIKIYRPMKTIEASPAQAAAETAGCACRRGSVEAFSRREPGLTDDRRGLFMMRPVLHYWIYVCSPRA
jgi:hypothetical protein